MLPKKYININIYLSIGLVNFSDMFAVKVGIDFFRELEKRRFKFGIGYSY